MIVGSAARGIERGSTWYSADGRTWDGPHPAPEALGLGGGFLPSQLVVGSDSIFAVWEAQVIGRLRP